MSEYPKVIFKEKDGVTEVVANSREHESLLRKSLGMPEMEKPDQPKKRGRRKATVN